jgi:hypothetical protein
MTKPSHAKVYANDAERVAAGPDGNARIDRFERRISIDGDVSPELERKLLEIADKCPAHGMLALPNAMTFTPVAGSVDSCDAPKQPLELIIRASPSGRYRPCCVAKECVRRRTSNFSAAHANRSTSAAAA